MHLDVKKLGKIRDGGGWRARGRAATCAQKSKAAAVGFDYVHVAVDDHSRLAYAEILPDEKGATAGAFLLRAAAYLATAGIPVIERVITDNAWTYRRSTGFRQAVAELGARQKFIRPHCPGRTAKPSASTAHWPTEWAYRKPYTSADERAAALPDWLEYYNTQRPHTALGGLNAHHAAVTNVLTEYT